MEQAAIRLEKIASVCGRIGISRSELYRRLQSGSFPRPVQLGTRAVAWDSREVDGYIESLLAARWSP